MSKNRQKKSILSQNGPSIFFSLNLVQNDWYLDKGATKTNHTWTRHRPTINQGKSTKKSTKFEVRMTFLAWKMTKVRTHVLRLGEICLPLQNFEKWIFDEPMGTRFSFNILGTGESESRNKKILELWVPILEKWTNEVAGVPFFCYVSSNILTNQIQYRVPSYC